MELQFVRRESLNLETLSVFTFQYVLLYVLILWYAYFIVKFQGLSFSNEVMLQEKKKKEIDMSMKNHKWVEGYKVQQAVSKSG